MNVPHLNHESEQELYSKSMKTDHETVLGLTTRWQFVRTEFELSDYMWTRKLELICDL